jgi:CheY-like chemotaxis protein
LSTLLAVDDSKTMRRVIEITFAGENHRLVLADSADDALAKLRSEQPAVVLIDANLGGGGGGYGLCQTVKRENPGARVLLLASKQQPYDRPRGSSSGADDFIDKPFDTQQLIEKVNGLVRAAAAAPPPPAVAQPAPAPLGERPRAQTLAYGGTAGSPAAPPRPQSPLVAPPAAPGFPPPPPAVVATPEPPAVAQPPAMRAPAAAMASATSAIDAAPFANKLSGLGLTDDQVQAVLALSREVVERVVWEVVPVLAETLIKEEIRRLTAD